MLSRVAESLYWISRYVERAENVARLLDVGFHLELDAIGLRGEFGSDPSPIEGVLSILACREAFVGPRGGAHFDRDAVLEFLTFDRDNSHSILAMIARARENARATQEALSGEVWSQVNKLYLYLVSPRARRRFGASPPRFYDGIKRACILFGGLADGTLPRTEAYHFLQVGRYLERVNQISRILSVKLHGLRDDGPLFERAMRVVHWTSLLRSCSAYEAYLREHGDRVDPAGVVRYLVLDAEFPRAIRFCVARCHDSLGALGGGEEGSGTEAERLLGRLDGELRYGDVDEIFGQGLQSFLAGIQEAGDRVGEAIHAAYFST